ncbi:MAG: HD domain-containing protein [Clostridia bacterium]|nr:HD domain-containing protein [Clostridia bacterium]
MEHAFADLRDLIQGFAAAMNLISPEVQNHHQQVAYLSYRIADQMQLAPEIRRNIVYGALLHDVGSIIMGPDTPLLELERKPFALAKKSAEILHILPQTRHLASIVGFNVLSPVSMLRPISSIRELSEAGQVIRLSDFISLLIKPDIPILNQANSIVRAVRQCERDFSSRVIDAFIEISKMESVWMDLLLRQDAFLDFLPEHNPLTLEHTQSLTEIMSLIIDFRSPFTAMHSAGVAATAVELARRVGMSEEEQVMMRIAGNLHDLGKLKVPKAILEKPGKLTDEEFNVIKEHAYYTTLFLSRVNGFEQIAKWAGQHHEKLNGGGYPFHLKAEQLPLGSRILACADIFAAITEERPYRKSMPREKVTGIMQENAEKGALSPIIVQCLLDNYDEIDSERDRQSHIAGRRYFESIQDSESASKS